MGCTSFHYLDRYPQSPSVDQPGKSKPSPNMRFSSLLTASMASVVAGQGLTQTPMDQPSLSNLTTYLNLFPTLLNELSSMSNITDVISALFSYHVLNGSYTNFSTMPEFVHTALMPGMYANVTGGQAVEALTSSNMSMWLTTSWSCQKTSPTLLSNWWLLW